jgi:midasin
LYNLWSIFSKKEGEEEKFGEKGKGPEDEQKLQTSFFSDEQFRLVSEILEKLESLSSTPVTPELSETPSELRKKLSDLQKLNRSQISGHFEWIDSILISTMKSGNWILVDNVNLCLSSVLDRLNPLLEPNGCIVLNERG